MIFQKNIDSKGSDISEEVIIGELAQVVGRNHCLVDAGMRAPYEMDWSRRWVGEARVVVRPESTSEVAAVLEICSRNGWRVVPQGGNTGMVGGSVARCGGVLLSLRRLNAIGSVDCTTGQLNVGAGATLGAVNALLKSSGRRVGVDIASRDSATIGGMVATNAGGIHALRYGTMRSQVAGMEAVLADGSVVSRLSGLLKDNTGYSIADLLIGSEGTLAVITTVRLKTVKIPSTKCVMLLGLNPVVKAVGRKDQEYEDGKAWLTTSDITGSMTDNAVGVLASIREVVENIEAAEIMYDKGFEITRSYLDIASPFKERYLGYLLIELSGTSNVIERVGSSLTRDERVGDVALGVDSRTIDGLWSYRERHTEAIAMLGVAHKLDVSLPLERLGEFVRSALRASKEANADCSVVMFGHLGDGNLHVNVLGLEDRDETVDGIIFQLVARLGGSISAEHGVGSAKVRYLELVRSDIEIRLMRSVKRAFDPNGILNPGVILPVDC